MPMDRALPLALTLLLAACQEDDATGPKVDVPSGRALSLVDVITNAPGPAGAAARFRFLVPDLSAEDAETALADMQVVCDSFALERTRGTVPEPQQIIDAFAPEFDQLSLLTLMLPWGE